MYLFNPSSQTGKLSEGQAVNFHSCNEDLTLVDGGSVTLQPAMAEGHTWHGPWFRFFSVSLVDKDGPSLWVQGGHISSRGLRPASGGQVGEGLRTTFPLGLLSQMPAPIFWGSLS